MHCELETKEIQEINDTNILPQTSFWASVKNRQGFTPYAFNMEATKDLLHPEKSHREKVDEDLLVLIKYVNETDCYAYVPYGPKLEPNFENYGLFLEELSEVLRSYLPSRCMLIRYDLHWESQWAEEDDFYDNNNHWVGPPSSHAQEFRINFNTSNWNLQKSPSDILPTNTFFLNLIRNPDQILQNMKPKTRYNIRLSARRGIRVKEYGMEKIKEWYALYRETALRNNLTLHHIDYFYSILAHQRNAESGVKISLLMADYEGEYLAGMFLILSKERGTYLYGASSTNKRHLMASYAVQWEAIKLAKAAGCKEYDMFGAAPNGNTSHPLHGLYRYKSGFGGNLHHRMGCWDYPLMEEEYVAFRALEVNNQKYHAV